MSNIHGSYDIKLAHSVQQDYQRDAANARLAKAANKRAGSQSHLIKGYLVTLVSLFFWTWHI